MSGRTSVPLICPSCGAGLQIVSARDGRIGRPYVQSAHRRDAPVPLRWVPAPFAACGACEHCEELDPRTLQPLQPLAAPVTLMTRSDAC